MKRNVFGYNGNGNIVKEIRVDLHNNNQLQIQLNVLTTEQADAWAEYWTGSDSTHAMQSTTVKNALQHPLVLLNITPKTNYSYHIVTIQNGVKRVSNTYTFQSQQLPVFLQDQFKAIMPFPKLIPAEFKNGFMLVNKNYAPGLAF